MSDPKPQLVTVEELAKISGVSIATIDHYVDIGLLNIDRRKGTTRLFNLSLCVERIKEIHGLLGRGLRLKEIKARVINGIKQTKDLLPFVKEELKFSNNIGKAVKNKKRTLIRFLLISCGMSLAFCLGGLQQR